MRILITGSRDWPIDRFEHVDDAICDTFGYKRWREIYPTITIIHGGCATGADAAAHKAAQRLIELDPQIFAEEIHQADWSHWGKATGPIRNQLMVDLGADTCLAFPIGASRGTRDCMRRAEAAGIPVINNGESS